MRGTHPAPRRLIAEHKGSVVDVRLEECADDSYRVYSLRRGGDGEHPHPPSYYTTQDEAERDYGRRVHAGRPYA